MKDYKISIVTPFHNVDLKMFKNAFKSMINQTYGIENIQWVIVVHNSGEEYLKGVQEITKGYESIVVKVLNNDKKTPSSPRNYGMQFATGKYIGFLDGDDSLTPDCIETSVEHIEKTNSQMLIFRREYELEDRNCMPFTELTLWNQTLKEVVIEQGHFEKETMFDVRWGFVTSKIFDREFLVKNNIIFSEDIPYAEDVHFCILAFGNLERVCYLPQFIGYHYFINGGSLVQSGDTKNGQTCVNYAVGFNKIFSTGLYYDIPINYIVNGLAYQLLYFVMGSPDITLEQLKRIRDILKPYARMAEPCKATKISSQIECDEMYKAVQMLMKPEEIYAEKYSHDNSAPETQNDDNKFKVLAQILKDNSNTDFAKYGFNTCEDFLEKVPLQTYDDYAPLVELTMKIGEKNIFTSYPILFYARTSGTMGNPRYIPCTKPYIEDYVKEFEKIINNKKSLLLFESLPHTFSNDAAYIDSISGAVLYYFVENNKNLAEKLFTSPLELLFPKELSDTLHARLFFALLDTDIKQIIAPFTWRILEMFTHLESNWRDLCDEIEAGKLKENLSLSNELRETLNAKLQPNKQRADELRKIFADGFDEPVANKIWPSLEKITASGTGSFEIYTDNLRRYVGNLNFSNGIYAASEALIAVAEDDNSDRYIMKTDQNFFEFLPISGNNNKPVLSEDLEPGQAYELVVTNKSGLYRYKLGDIITVISNSGDAPVIIFNHRRFTNSDALTEDEIYRALRSLENMFKFELNDFAYWYDDDKNSWNIFIEPSSRSLDTLKNLELQKIKDAFNFRFEQINHAFAEKINAGEINPCEIKFNEPETHLLYRDIDRFRKKLSSTEVKPIHFIDTYNEVIKKFFMKNTFEVK